MYLNLGGSMLNLPDFYYINKTLPNDLWTDKILSMLNMLSEIGEIWKGQKTPGDPAPSPISPEMPAGPEGPEGTTVPGANEATVPSEQGETATVPTEAARAYEQVMKSQLPWQIKQMATDLMNKSGAE